MKLLAMCATVSGMICAGFAVLGVAGALYTGAPVSEPIIVAIVIWVAMTLITTAGNWLIERLS